MVHFDFGNKQFTEWLLSFDTEKRSRLLTEVQHQLAQMGLRDDQMQRALQQVCQHTEVQVYRLSSEEITMYMQWSSDDYYSRTLRNSDWQDYRRPKYYNQRSQFRDTSEYEYLNQSSSYREGYRDHYNWNKYSGSNYESRPVGRENFKWRQDHQSPLSQKRANEKRRLCYSFDNEDRKQIVSAQESNLRERNYYEEEARRDACLEKLSILDRRLSLSEDRHSYRKTWKYSDYRKGRPFIYKKTLYCDETSAKTDRFNKNQKKQVSDIEKCAKSDDSNANLCTKFRKSDIGVGIATKSVNNNLTESSKTKTQILNSDDSTKNKKFDISVTNDVVTGTEVPKTQSFHDDTVDKELERVASSKKLCFDSVNLSCLSSDKGHSLPSVEKSLNSETKTDPSQSVHLTSKSEVKIKSINEPSSGSEIPSHLSGESSEHNTSVSSGKTLESVLSSTLHCAEDRKRVSGIGSRIKDTAGSVGTVEKLPGTTTKKEQTILSSQEHKKTNKHLKESDVISKLSTDSVKKTSPHCYTTIDEYYNCKLEKPSQKNTNFVTSDKSCDTKVPSCTSNTRPRSCEIKTPQSLNSTQSKHCGIKNPSKVSGNIQNKNVEVKTPVPTKSNFQQELGRVAVLQGIVGISDFNVLDKVSHQKNKENDTRRPVTSKEILFPVPQVKKGTASIHPIEKGLALSDSKPNNSLNNPSCKNKEIPQDTNATLKHGLKSVKSVQRRSSVPVKSSSDKFKRKRCHSYAGEKSQLFGQIDILKKGNAPVSKVNKCTGKEETDIKKDSGNSSAVKKKKQKKLVPLDNKAKPKKSSQSLSNQEKKLPVLKDKSKIAESYSSGNLSIKKRKKIRDLFGEEDFEEPRRKKLSNSGSEQSTKQTKGKQRNITDESLVNPLQESDILAKNENHIQIPVSSNTITDQVCPDVINNFSECIPDTILGTKLIAENIEVKVEINMETIPLLFPGPQDEIPDDSVRETENIENTVCNMEIADMSDVSMNNKDLATSQSTTSMSDNTIVTDNGCEKNKQSSCSAEVNRTVDTLVVQDSALQSELIISEDTANKLNNTKEVPDVEENVVETPKDIETGDPSDPSKKKSIVTGGSVRNYIQKESQLEGMGDTLNNSDREMTEISTDLTVIPPSSHTGKSLVTSSLSSQMTISDSIMGGRSSTDQSGLCHSNEGIVGKSQDQRALTSEHQNHEVINPCDNQIVKNTSELVQQNNILHPNGIPAAPPTYRIRVRDPAYLGIAANSSNSNPTNVHSSNVHHSQINCEPTKDKTAQSFYFPTMDKNLQQLAEITYTMLLDRDRVLERIKAANSLTCLTDIKSSEKEFAKKDFFSSLVRKGEIYCKLLKNVKVDLRDKTEDTLLCRVNEISKHKEYMLHDIISIKDTALQVERRRLQSLDSNNVPPRLESIHPHLNPNVHTLTPSTPTSQNAITLPPPPAPSQNPILTVTHNQNSTNINYIPSSSNEFDQIVSQPGHEIASEKTRESASQMQRVNVQNVQNRLNQISGANSVRPPPPSYLQSFERHVQNTAQTNIAGVPAPAYSGYTISLVPNNQNQNIFQNSANQQNKVHPPGTFHSSTVQTTQQNQISPHPASRSSTANLYQHKPVPLQIGFQNSSSNALYQQKQSQDPSSYRRHAGQSAIPHKQAFPNVEINQQTPFHGSIVRTSSQQNQISQVGYSSALHPSNQLRDQHLRKINASQFTVNNYKDMQSAVQNPNRNQRAVRAFSAAGSDPIVPSQDLQSFYRKEQQQQLRMQQHLAQNQNLSTLISSYPQIRSQQQLMQFYQLCQKYRQGQHQKEHQDQFQQSQPRLEMGHLQHQQQVQMQQEQLQQSQQWHQQEQLVQTKRHSKEHHHSHQRHQEQLLQTQQRHQQEQLLQTQQWHQQEHLLQIQQQHQQEQLQQPQKRHQQEQLLQPQEWHQQVQQHQQEQLQQPQQHLQEQILQQQHQQSQSLQHSQEQLKQSRHQQEQLELSQQYLLQQQQLPPPPPLITITQQPRNESQIPIRQIERFVYDHAKSVRQLQPNSLPLSPPEMGAVSTEPLPRSTVYHLPNPNSTSGKRENHQNSLRTGFEMSRSETTNQKQLENQTLLNQPHEHQRSNSIQQLSPMYPPQSNTLPSVIHVAVSESQGQLSGHITSERHEQMSDSIPSVQASRPVPEVETEQATRVNTMSSDVQENASTECSLNTVANVGIDFSVKNVTFSNNNICRSSESERELPDPDKSHGRRRTSDIEHQPSLETEITLKSLLLSRNEGSATHCTVAQTFVESQITNMSKQLEKTSTLNSDANKVSVVNRDDSIEESNQICKKPRRNRNENIIADLTASQKVPHLQTTEKNIPSEKTKTNSPETTEADPTMLMPLQGVSESQDISEHCDRISTKSPDIMEITIEPSDFRNDRLEPRNDITVQNCKKPRKRTRRQRDMPLLEDNVEGLVVRSPLNDCVLIVQEAEDIEVIGEYQPQQLRTLSRDSGYTTPTPITGVVKEDDQDVIFEEEAIKNEDISDNVHYEEIMDFEDQKPDQEKSHDGKLWVEIEGMSSSSSDDLLISRIKKEEGGVVFMELDKESSCALCGKTSQVMCSECKSITYCSKTCQIKDWNESHYLICLGSNNDV